MNEKIILGIVFFILSILFQFSSTSIDPLIEFSYSLAAFFLSITSLFTEPLSKVGKFTLFKVIKGFLYFLGILSFFLIPNLKGTNFITLIIESYNATALFMVSLGIVFFSFYFSERDQKQVSTKIKVEQKRAVIEERQRITTLIKQITNKRTRGI